MMVFFRYTYEGKDVLKGLDLQVFENEFLCILGDNGVGKSTLLKIISGVNHLYSGVISIKNRKTSRKKRLDSRIRIAFLPQNPITLFVHDMIKKEFASLISEQITKDEIDEIIATLELEKIIESHPYDLSGGELQKAAIGKLLLTKPSILLLDEPTKGLDAISKEKLAIILKNLQATGITIVMVSHDIEFAAKYSNRVALYFDGKIVAIEDRINFFNNNSYYTTAAKRMSFPYFQNTTTVKQVIELGLLNGGKNE